MVIYSDIMAPTPESFEKAYGVLNPGTAADKVRSGDFDGKPSPGVTSYFGVTLLAHADTGDRMRSSINIADCILEACLPRS